MCRTQRWGDPTLSNVSIPSILGTSSLPLGLEGSHYPGGWNWAGFQKKEALVLFLGGGEVGIGKSHPNPDLCCPSLSGGEQTINPINLLCKACAAPSCSICTGIGAAPFTCQLGNLFPWGSDPGSVCREGSVFPLTSELSAVPCSTFQVIFRGETGSQLGCFVLGLIFQMHQVGHTRPSIPG